MAKKNKVKACSNHPKGVEPQLNLLQPNRNKLLVSLESKNIQESVRENLYQFAIKKLLQKKFSYLANFPRLIPSKVKTGVKNHFFYTPHEYKKGLLSVGQFEKFQVNKCLKGSDKSGKLAKELNAKLMRQHQPSVSIYFHCSHVRPPSNDLDKYGL